MIDWLANLAAKTQYALGSENSTILGCFIVIILLLGFIFPSYQVISIT